MTTTRVALYARFSSDKQNERSAEDQLDALRRIVTSRGWTEVAAYKDEGISGTALATRPGVQALMRLAASGKIDAVLCEALDRLSRGQSDTARLYELLSFYGVRLETGAGQVTELHIGMEGTMNRLQIVELGKKTRRGQIGRVKAGFSGTGKAYGYDLVAGQPGALTINEAEAQVVRRIFEEYVAGASNRLIAGRLNADSVRGPRGGVWRPSAILTSCHGLRDGVLARELYAGLRVFNKRHARKHPETGKFAVAMNPPDEWVSVPAPDLRIISDDLWERAQARMAAVSQVPPHMARRPQRLLSGLVKCGLCGGAMTFSGGNLRCRNQLDQKSCTNTKSIPVEKVDARVLAAIKTGLLSPEAIAEAVRGFHEVANEAHRSAQRDRAEIERELGEVGRRIERAQDTFERGGMEMDELLERRLPLNARRQELRERLALAAEPHAVRLHPKAADQYREMASDLLKAVENPDNVNSRTFLRSIIERIVFTPRAEKGGYEMRVDGALGRLLNIKQDAEAVVSERGASARIGPSSSQYATLLRVSFAA